MHFFISELKQPIIRFLLIIDFMLLQNINIKNGGRSEYIILKLVTEVWRVY